MMRLSKLFLILFLVFLFIPVHAETSLSLNGYYKNFSVVFDPPKIDSSKILTFPDRPMGMVNNRLRLNIFYDLDNFFSFSLAYNISPRIQDPALFDESLFVADIDLFQYRFSDLKERLYPSNDKDQGSFGIYQNLDRFSLTIRTGPVDIIIGRQPIAWGSARVINPTDIIAPFTFEELDKEDRVGVDAVRVRIPIGFMGELDTGYIVGENLKFEKSSFYVRGKFYVSKTDFSLLLLGFQENLLAGLDIARSIGGAGFWFESACVFGNVFDSYESGKKNNYFRTTVGLDYSFKGKLYGFIEYHFSGAGTNKPEDYLINFSKPGLSEGAVYLMGRHYLDLGLSYQITPLIIFTGQALFNISDLSLFFAPQLEYNIAENIYLSVGSFIGLGKGPEYSTGDGISPAVKFQSEFGGYPNIFFSSFRVYF